MKNNKGFAPVAVVLIVVAVLAIGGIAYYAGKSSSVIPQNIPENIITDDSVTNSNTTTETKLTLFSGSNGMFSAQSYGLTSVKIYYYPTGTGITQPSLLGSMNLTGTNGSGLQTWSLSAYPKKLDGSLSTDGFLTTNIYAVGFVGNTQENKIEYPYTGASDIYNHLYTGTSNQVNSETSLNEVFKNQPGAVKSITVKSNNQWILAVDLLSRNPKWLPGDDSTGGFFINQNTKIRNLTVSNNTKAYDCETQYADGHNVPPSLQNTAAFIAKIQDTINKSKTDKGLVGEFGYTAYFDISGTNITAIYQQCLP